jgi:hypothetical protein
LCASLEVQIGEVGQAICFCDVVQNIASFIKVSDPIKWVLLKLVCKDDRSPLRIPYNIWGYLAKLSN